MQSLTAIFCGRLALWYRSDVEIISRSCASTLDAKWRPKESYFSMALTPFLLAWMTAYRLLPFQRTISMFFVSFSVYVKNSTLSHSPPMLIRPKENYRAIQQTFPVHSLSVLLNTQATSSPLSIFPCALTFEYEDIAWAITTSSRIRFPNFMVA